MASKFCSLFILSLSVCCISDTSHAQLIIEGVFRKPELDYFPNASPENVDNLTATFEIGKFQKVTTTFKNGVPRIFIHRVEADVSANIFQDGQLVKQTTARAAEIFVFDSATSIRILEEDIIGHFSSSPVYETGPFRNENVELPDAKPGNLNSSFEFALSRILDFENYFAKSFIVFTTTPEAGMPVPAASACVTNTTQTKSPPLPKQILYVFEGKIPNGASSHPSVADGEIFVATFVIQTDVTDATKSETTGTYFRAVARGEIQFSGGYTSPLEFTGANVLVLNQHPSTGTSLLLDGIHIGLGSGGQNVIQAVTAGIDTTLSSDMLPAPETSFLSQTDGETTPLFQLTYTDALGSIEYSVLDEANVSFSASEVMEFVFGDINGDSQVDLLDVGPFVDLLSTGQFQVEADINQDGLVNLLDVEPFIELLVGK